LKHDQITRSPTALTKVRPAYRHVNLFPGTPALNSMVSDERTGRAKTKDEMSNLRKGKLEMKTIASILAATAVLFAASAAQADFSSKLFEKQSLYSENIESDVIHSGNSLHPYGSAGADVK